MILEECNQSHDWPEDGRSNADKGHFARHQKSARKTGKMKNCCKSFLKSAKKHCESARKEQNPTTDDENDPRIRIWRLISADIIIFHVISCEVSKIIIRICTDTQKSKLSLQNNYIQRVT